MAEKHSSKGIMVATIVVAIVLTAVVVPFSMKGEKSAADANSSDQADSRIQPVAKFELAKAAPAAAAGPKDGATVYNSVCGACHGTGVAGAPRLVTRLPGHHASPRATTPSTRASLVARARCRRRVARPTFQMTKSRARSITWWGWLSKGSSFPAIGRLRPPFLSTTKGRLAGAPARAGFWRAEPQELKQTYFLTGSAVLAGAVFAASAAWASGAFG